MRYLERRIETLLRRADAISDEAVDIYCADLATFQRYSRLMAIAAELAVARLRIIAELNAPLLEGQKP